MADNISTMSVGFDFHAMTNAVHKYNSLKCMIYVWWPRPFASDHAPFCYSMLLYVIVVISDLSNLLVSYKTISENKKQPAFHVSWC